jgi:hypothetical protein
VKRIVIKIYLNVVLNTVEFSTTSVEKSYKMCGNAYNGGPYSHLSPRCTDCQAIV